jgi:hypothetical protein
MSVVLQRLVAGAFSLGCRLLEFVLGGHGSLLWPPDAQTPPGPEGTQRR